MAELYKAKDLIKVITHSEKPPNCDTTLQIQAKYAHEGTARGIWQVNEKFINGIGVAMGGFVASAADIMMAYAIASKLQNNQSFASIDLHTTFHKPILQGEVLVEAKVERMGKQIAYVLAELFQKDKKVASVVSSIILINE